jgi:hypothetical protein
MAICRSRSIHPVLALWALPTEASDLCLSLNPSLLDRRWGLGVMPWPAVARRRAGAGVAVALLLGLGLAPTPTQAFFASSRPPGPPTEPYYQATATPQGMAYPIRVAYQVRMIQACVLCR